VLTRNQVVHSLPVPVSVAVALSLFRRTSPAVAVQLNPRPWTISALLGTDREHAAPASPCVASPSLTREAAARAMRSHALQFTRPIANLVVPSAAIPRSRPTPTAILLFFKSPHPCPHPHPYPYPCSPPLPLPFPFPLYSHPISRSHHPHCIISYTPSLN
jgi:hypothetical protein